MNQAKLNEHFSLDVFVGGGHSQGNYKGYYKEDSPNFGRYDSAQSFNKSGEWILYKGGVMLTYKFKRIIWLSVIIGFLSCMGGLFISYFLNVPSGASIIFFSILIYAVCKVAKSISTRIQREENKKL